MLFESFWKPIDRQIEQIDQYFDPDLTPPAFLPWLASWVGMPLDSTLPLERVRELLKNARMLFQCRGTLHALKTYLEIYTTGQVSIIARQASNLVLGPSSMLGMETALGTSNQPNTVSITLTLPRTELARTQFNPETYQQKIVEVVRDLVPAHVVYEVKCLFSGEQP
jgi:phage tail-like protein